MTQLQNNDGNMDSHRRWTAACAAVVTMLAVSALAVEAKSGEAATDMEGDVIRVTVPAAPAPITGVSGPDVEGIGSLGELDDLEFVVPVLARPELRLPELPPVNVEAIREASRAWLGDGVLAAPTTVIEVDGPDLAALEQMLDADRVDRIVVPHLERPALPEPPAIR